VRCNGNARLSNAPICASFFRLPGAQIVTAASSDGRTLASRYGTIGLTALCLLIFVGLTGWMLLQSHGEAAARAETRAMAYSQAVSTNIQLLLDASQQALLRIDDQVGDTLTDPAQSALVDLDLAVDALPLLVQAWVFDSSGRPRLTNAETSQAVNASDREYFQVLRDGATTTISPLLISRSSGDAVFVVARRLERAGRFIGVAIVVIPAAYMDSFRAPLELEENSTVGILREDGQLVARSPVPAEGQDLSGYTLFTELLPKSDSGTYFAHSPTDGIDRIVGYRRIPRYPLVAVAAIDQEETFAPFWRMVKTLTVIAVPGLVALLLFAAWLMRAQSREERIRAELSRAVESNNVLLREIHHRVKNNLQQVQALVSLQPIPAELRQEMSRRIGAMVAVHEHMYRSDQYEAVDTAQYLPALVEKVRGSFQREVTVKTDIETIRIDREEALPLALIVSEVLANAIKHAFPDGRAGEIAVRMWREGERASLEIIDNGVGFDPGTVQRGMGTRLIGGLAAQLNAEYAFNDAQGTRFTLSFQTPGPQANT
jgi:two-component sensor histidine kinase